MTMMMMKEPETNTKMRTSTRTTKQKTKTKQSDSSMINHNSDRKLHCYLKVRNKKSVTIFSLETLPQPVA